MEDVTERRLVELALRGEQDKLRLSEERYRSLVAATAAVVFSTNGEGHFVEPQMSWAEYTGQNQEEASELGWLSAIYPEDRCPLEEDLSKALKESASLSRDTRVWNGKLGEYQFCELRLVPLGNTSGKKRPREWVGTLTDVHQRKKLEAELRKFKFLTDNATDAHFLSGAKGRLIYVNRVACELLGYSEQELLSMNVAELDLRNGSRFKKMIEDGLPGTVTRFDSSFIKRDGSSVTVEMSLSLFCYLGENYVLGIARDISERKAVEESLRRHAEELARSNRELERFAYVSSHDLKEPLRMVTLYVQLLQAHLGHSLDATALEYLDYVKEGADRMRALINDLLAYAKVGKDLTPFGEFESREALDTALEILAPSVLESKGEISVAPLPTVIGSYSQVTQLFQNLISNAIKFRSDAPPVIEISAKRLDGVWAFSVKDNGIGIDPAYFKRIFVVFQRLHASPRYPGTGVGLSLCQKIVENHGGRIWVDSKLGKGSTFYFTLGPRSAAADTGENFRVPKQKKPPIASLHDGA